MPAGCPLMNAASTKSSPEPRPSRAAPDCGVVSRWAPAEAEKASGSVARSRGLRDGDARMVRRPGRSGCGFACLSLAGLRSEAFQLLLEVCDFFTEGRDFVFQVGYAVAIGGWNGGIGDGIRGRGRPRHTGICHAEVFRIAGEQVHVARFFGAGLSWKNSCQRRISLHETLQGGLHFGEIFEALHTFGASAELAGRLRTAQQEDAEHGSLSAGEVEHFLQAMLVFGDPAVD